MKMTGKWQGKEAVMRDKKEKKGKKNISDMIRQDDFQAKISGELVLAVTKLA